MKLQVAGKLDNSLVNGEGLRYVLFLSGCKHHCDGCQNPQTWNKDYGDSMEIDDIFKDIKLNSPLIDGITYSGGDPFEQAEGLSILSDKIKNELNINIWSYTGYTLEGILDNSDNNKIKLLNYIDVLVDGPFEKDNMNNSLRYTGSANQRIIYLKNGKPYKILKV